MKYANCLLSNVLFIAIFLSALSGCSQRRGSTDDYIDPSNGDFSTNCGASECHDATPIGHYPPESGKHTQHLNPDNEIDCSDCHKNYNNRQVHKNGEINGFDSGSGNQKHGNIVFFYEGNDASWQNGSGTCNDINCHGDADWYSTGSPDCRVCHTPSGSHVVHTTLNGKGPVTALECADCHDTGTHSSSNFADGKDLDTTGVCDSCHSPNGAYDGVNDTEIGAKYNWEDGVYNSSSLSSGKERWCSGCHDNLPANSLADGSGVSAPDIAGDNNTYGFYYNGHGRTGADKNCLDCHSADYTHIDGDATTYSFDSSYYAFLQSGVAYQAGYRLKSASGGVPLMIPAIYDTTFSYNSATMRDNAFRLCFDCHDSSKVLDDTPGNGIDSNFKASLPNPPRNYSYAWGSGGDINEHVSHIMNYVLTSWDSDRDINTNGEGATNGFDSLAACSTCHNVHGAAGTEGSTNEVMIRDGRLAGRSGFGFSYVVEDAAGYPLVTSTGANQSNSVGAIFRNNASNMCARSMCHGNPAPPAGSGYDATGSSWGTYLEYYRFSQDY